MKIKQDPLSPPNECQCETITNIDNDLVDEQETNHPKSSTTIIDPLDSDITSSVVSSSPLLISISPSSSSSSPSLTLTTNENDTFEPFVEEEERKEEEQRCNDDYNLDEEKKNNSSLVYDYHASGILLINDEPTQTGLLGQEKKEKEEEKEERERASSPLPTLEQSNQQRTEDESSLQTLPNNFKPLAMIINPENSSDDNVDERFKKIEVEEIPDDEETLVNENNQSIEPTDYIHTDEEPRKKSTLSNLPPAIDDPPIKFNNVFSCYEKALAKVVDTPLEESSTNTQQSAEDPIALRALQRFEQRMSAAAAAAATKPNKEESNLLATKGKSSWSGSSSMSRKSLENLLKATEQQELRPAPTSTESSTNQSDGYIRPRKTFEDHSSNYGATLDSHQTSSLSNDPTTTNTEEQLQPTAIVENDDKRGE